MVYNVFPPPFPQCLALPTAIPSAVQVEAYKRWVLTVILATGAPGGGGGYVGSDAHQAALRAESLSVSAAAASAGGGGGGGGPLSSLGSHMNDRAFPAPPPYVTHALRRALTTLAEPYAVLAKRYFAAIAPAVPPASSAGHQQLQQQQYMQQSAAQVAALASSAARSSLAALTVAAGEHAGVFNADGAFELVSCVCELAPLKRVEALAKTYTVVRVEPAVAEAVGARAGADAVAQLHGWVS